MRRQGLRGIIALLALVGAALAAPALAQEPERPGQEDSLIRAVFADGRLWLLSDAGALYSIVERGRREGREDLPEPALDLCRDGGQPLVVTGRRDGAAWTLRRRRGDAWQLVGRIVRQRDERLVALGCDGGRTTVLTSNRIVDAGSGERGAGGARDVALSEPLSGGRVSTTLYAGGGQLYVGFNHGEWGGGLRRIDRASGRVAIIERNVGGGLCDGPLNTQCDPVNGIAADPSRPDCVVVAIGLVHMLMHGRLTRVCRDRVESLYFKAYPDSAVIDSRLGADGEPVSTIAFFGLIARGGELWAMGVDGLHRVDGQGHGDVTARPSFETIGRFRVSFALPDVVLVLTSANQRASLSGAVPLMAAR
jgi:hypothetical protein